MQPPPSHHVADRDTSIRKRRVSNAAIVFILAFLSQLVTAVYAIIATDFSQSKIISIVAIYTLIFGILAQAAVDGGYLGTRIAFLVVSWMVLGLFVFSYSTLFVFPSIAP